MSRIISIGLLAALAAAAVNAQPVMGSVIARSGVDALERRRG